MIISYNMPLLRLPLPYVSNSRKMASTALQIFGCSASAACQNSPFQLRVVGYEAFYGSLPMQMGFEAPGKLKNFQILKAQEVPSNIETWKAAEDHLQSFEN